MSSNPCSCVGAQTGLDFTTPIVRYCQGCIVTWQLLLPIVCEVHRTDCLLLSLSHYCCRDRIVV